MSTFTDLLEIARKQKRVYIQPHNVPDPDAIASSFALKVLLKHFGVKSKIIYVDLIEKANSKRMVEIFKIGLEQKEDSFVSAEKDFIILVDAQQGNSNITDFNFKNIAVIDHHSDLSSGGYIYKDVRNNVGSCATIIAEYFKEAGVEPSNDVATALVYGIMTDTDNLTRNSNKADADMFYWLYNLADFTMIKNLRMNEIGKEDIYAYAKALQNIEIYGNIGFIHIEDCNDSLLGTISDMVYTIEGVNIVVSYAKRDDGIKFSIRSGEKDIRANKLIKHILSDKGIGGGHDVMAGGFITKESMNFLVNKELDTYVRYRVLSYLENENCL